MYTRPFIAGQCTSMQWIDLALQVTEGDHTSTSWLYDVYILYQHIEPHTNALGN